MLNQQSWHTQLRLHRKKYLALYNLLKQEAADGGPMPSERELARRLSLSRGTVRLACEMLVADGFLRVSPGRGYHAIESARPREGQRNGPRRRTGPQPRLSPLGIAATPPPTIAPQQTVPLDLRAGSFAPTDFPAREWKHAMHEALRDTAWLDGSVTCDPAGWPRLREAIAVHLRMRRGLNADPENVVITNGSGQALALLSLLLIRSGDRIPVEEPCYSGTRSLIELAGGIPVPTGLDAEGMIVPDVPARLAFLSPGNQYPTGLTYSRERLLAILHWARRNDAWIIEDDYDADFRHRGLPPQPLCAMAPDRVCYTGTFSRSLGPAVRIGYAVVPAASVGPLQRIKRMFEERPTNLIEQAALASFMRSGAYERHLRRCTRTLSVRHDRLHTLLASIPGSPLQVFPSRTGLHIYAEWKPPAASFRGFVRSCMDQGLYFTIATSHHALRHRPAMLFGFSRIPAARLATVSRILARAVRSKSSCR